MRTRDKRRIPLIELANAYNIGTFYIGPKKKYIEISLDAITLVLGSFGVDATSPQKIQEALEFAKIKDYMRPAAPTLHKEIGLDTEFHFYIPKGLSARVSVRMEGGNSYELFTLNSEKTSDYKMVGDTLISHLVKKIKCDVAPGYHKIIIDIDGMKTVSNYIVTPSLIDLPLSIDEHKRWGYMSQFYSVRSSKSWGVGDFEDLAISCEKAAISQQADFMLINPTHAGEPSGHLTPSPYLPSSRRYLNAIYIRPEATPEYRELSVLGKETVDTLFDSVKDLNNDPNYIDRDKSWAAKIQALRAIYDEGFTLAREEAFEKFKQTEGQTLEGFAIWNMLYQRWGDPEKSDAPWTKSMLVNSPEIIDLANDNRKTVDFFKWLQFIANEQLRDAQLRAKNAGMRLGIIADLAVGVHPFGADVFANPDDFIYSASVGAPPDMFNQIGQDWSQPPLSPIALANTGYSPFKKLIQGVLKNVGAVRIDHILGMFRLWYIPSGHLPSDGAYVYYNNEIMIGILCLEAARNNAIIIGEDMGMVTPTLRKYLSSHGLLGTSVLWEERKKGSFKKPKNYRRLALSSITNHDFPPTAGYLEYEHVKLRERLGLLTQSYEEFSARVEKDVSEMLNLTRNLGFLTQENPSTEEIVIALHKMLASCPSVLICSTFVDSVGEKRVQNQPGTDNEYPNWRVPLADENGDAVLLDNLFENPRLIRLAEAVREQTYS